jgi:hypothetical protein
MRPAAGRSCRGSKSERAPAKVSKLLKPFALSRCAATVLPHVQITILDGEGSAAGHPSRLAKAK